ncbi:MAG TPA: aromatic amino acid ammonia-lyase [Solirubrobacteraceae bacterium]|nr:aromatic amino acid ammonia-lyase [Solirubrobacteraceae bacterium]
MLRIGDAPLTPAALAEAARGGPITVELTTAAHARMARGHEAAERATALGPVYGRTTGVGANREIDIGADDLAGHALRLLRSHAGGLGEPLPEDVVRATVLVRLAQMAAGGGSRPEVAAALAALLADARMPTVRDLGGLGTGDLTVLAQLGLALAGEGEDAGPARLEIGAGDALPLMSSNAATFASAALVLADLWDLLDAGLGVAALSFQALRGNREAFADAVTEARPLPGITLVAARLRALTAGAEPPARRQDPFGLRCLPPVAGALAWSLHGLDEVLAVEINAAAENPLFAGGEALHNGGFHAASCALALDSLRLALVPFGSLAGARLSHLMAPDFTGLPPFLAADDSGSSGLMIAEYVAGDALARLRTGATPAVLGSVSISRGLEEHASFAWQSAGHARRTVGLLRTVIALEWVAAERALRMRAVPATGVLAGARALARDFDGRLEDRPLGGDVALAEAALPSLAELVRASD